MKFIIIGRKKCVSVNNNLYTAIKSCNRYAQRQAERLSEREILIGDEAELDILLEKEQNNPCEIIERKEIFREIMEIIENHLTKDERQLIIAVFLKGEKRNEAAQKMGLSYKQLTYRLNTALKRVREIYNENK